MTIDNVKCSSLLGASVGIGLGVLSLAKGKGIRNIKYGNKEVTLISSMSIFGGLLGGVLSDKGRNTKAKTREASQQMFGNIVIPLAIMTACNAVTKPMGTVARAVMAIASLLGGTVIGHRVMDKVNGKIFGNEQRYNVSLKDFLSDTDDMIYAVSTVTNSNFVNKAVASVVPITYIYMGYRTGKSQDKDFEGSKLNKVV